MLLWLWCRSEATAPIGPSMCHGCNPPKTKINEEIKIKKYMCVCVGGVPVSMGMCMYFFSMKSRCLTMPMK